MLLDLAPTSGLNITGMGSGYRLYAESDLERLEQIVALKFLGLPLKQIRRLLERRAPPMAEALRDQRAALEETKLCGRPNARPLGGCPILSMRIN